MSTLLNGARPPYGLKNIHILTGYSNGKLPNDVLSVGVRGLKMNLVSALKFRVLTEMAVYDGIPLSSTGDYRTFTQQEILLLGRYDRGYIAGRASYRYYQGTYWSLKPDVAAAATPGTSNHGMARARDFAVMLAGDTIPDSLRTADVKWLASHAPMCGIFFENKTEDWHGTDYAGDEVPDWVRNWGMTPETPPALPPFNPQSGNFSLYPLDKTKATLRFQDPPMCSDLVSYFQGVLRVRLGYALGVDGWFGEVSRDNAIWFQATHGLTSDGIVGPKTWAVIDSLA